MPMALWIVLFLVVDAIVVYFVFRHALRKNGGFTVAAGAFRAIASFSKEMHEETGRYLQANYSGDPAHLESAMSGLLGVARERAQREGMTVDDTLLKKLIEISAIKHRVAKPQEIRSALQRAA